MPPCECGCGQIAVRRFVHGHNSRRPLADRLWEKVDTSGGFAECWPFTGRIVHEFGYGRLSYKHKQISAHRLAWETTHGAIPDGLWVLHSCDNPPCCNPGHLFLGTVADNQRDMAQKGRGRNQNTAGALGFSGVDTVAYRVLP